MKKEKITVELNENEAELVRFALYKLGRSLHETYGIHQETLDCYDLIKKFCFEEINYDTDGSSNR